jgi:hypothetical protein
MANSLLTSMLPIGNLLSCYLLVTHIDRIAAAKFEVKVYSRSTHAFTHTHGYFSGNLRDRTTACSHSRAQSASNVAPPPAVTVAEVVGRPLHHWDELTGELQAVG